MSDLKTRTKWRKKNREKAEYYKQYYAGEAGDKIEIERNVIV